MKPFIGAVLLLCCACAATPKPAPTLEGKGHTVELSRGDDQAIVFIKISHPHGGYYEHCVLVLDRNNHVCLRGPDQTPCTEEASGWERPQCSEGPDPYNNATAAH